MCPIHALMCATAPDALSLIVPYSRFDGKLKATGLTIFPLRITGTYAGETARLA
jgi:hypothetical protein